MKKLSEEERTYALGMARKYFSDDPGFTSWHVSQFADPIGREIVAKVCALAVEQAAEIERLYNACVVTEHEVQQILGEALGYPWYKYDPKNFPDATADEHGVCVGDHVAATLAVEAANRIEALKALVGEILPHLRRPNYYGPGHAGMPHAYDSCVMCGRRSEGYDFSDIKHTPNCSITRAQDLGVLPKEG